MNLKSLFFTFLVIPVGIVSLPKTAISDPLTKNEAVIAEERNRPNVALGVQNGATSTAQLIEQGRFTITAYSSTEAETDSTPCIAADGTDICRRWAQGEDICASNDYPFGTVLMLGGSVMTTCTVADRMVRRYTGKKYVDLYFGSRTEEAWEFGLRKNVPVYIDSNNTRKK
ncbi:MAG: 3D domain-containing protein [Undibacterium sp.]